MMRFSLIASAATASMVVADAIRDRLQHSAPTINITGESYRGVKARKLASKKKDTSGTHSFCYPHN
jgi:hypothetical protein